jgi:hypothetical protein
VAFNYFLYMVSLELQILFDIQRNDTKQFWCLRHIWWESLQMSYGGWKIIFWMIQPICLGKVIHDMYKVNLKVWKTIHHVVCTLVGLPCKWITPKFFYQRQP